jgi:hypothetical protein
MTPDQEAKLATWLARPGWAEARALIEEVLGVPMNPLDAIIWRTRRHLWKDFSEPQP